MHAAWHERTGDPDVLRFGELADPDAPGPDQVTIRMAATSLDRVDLYWREGSHGMKLRWPQHVGGRDLAGTISAVGADVDHVAVGDRVVASAERTHAELVIAPAALTLPLPDHVPFEAAGVAPTAGRSAWAALVDRARIESGETVLIVAAGSGVGSFGQQIAQAHGCRVIATAGTESKRSRALQLGASAAVDHYRDDLADQILEATDGAGVDVVLDHAGGPVFETAIRVLAPRGRFVTCGVTAGHKSSIHLGSLFVKGLTLMGVGRPTDSEIRTHLDGLFDRIGAGDVTPQIHETFPLANIAQAHRALAGRDCFGKVALVP